MPCAIMCRQVSTLSRFWMSLNWKGVVSVLAIAVFTKAVTRPHPLSLLASGSARSGTPATCTCPMISSGSCVCSVKIEKVALKTGKDSLTDGYQRCHIISYRWALVTCTVIQSGVRSKRYMFELKQNFQSELQSTSSSSCSDHLTLIPVWDCFLSLPLA